MPSRYDDLLERQREELARLEAAEVSALLEVLEEARIRLAIELARGDELEATPFTLQVLRTNQAFVVRAMEDMGRKVEATLDLAATRANRLGVEDLETLLRAMEPEFLDAGDRLPVGALRRLTASQGLLLHKHSARRYTADILTAIQRELAVGLATGRSVAEVARRVTGAAGSTLTGVRGRGELIVRMETMRAFDAGHQAALEEAEELLDIEDDDDPLLARADEYLDARNHPFSRALHGKTRKVKGMWEVPLAEVLTAAEAMGATPTGILWPLVGGNYVGNQYPAHFHDRGRQVAWRESWGVDPEEHSSPPSPRNSRAGRPRTEPVRAYDPNAKPGGRPKKVRGEEGRARADRRENETADLLAQLGFDVVQLPEPTRLKAPDYTIGGVAWDCVAPTTPSALNVLDRARRKAADGQARRVVFNLADTPLTAADLQRAIEENPGYLEGSGVDELLVVTARPTGRPQLSRIW